MPGWWSISRESDKLAAEQQGAHARLNPEIYVYASFNATSIANWPASVSQGIEIMGSPDG
jgi:hypothetical protein